MTFGEMRRALRARADVYRHMCEYQEQVMRLCGPAALADISVTVPAATFDQVEWAMGRVRVWTPEQGWTRQNLLFVQIGNSRAHLLMKGRPVYRGAA